MTSRQALSIALLTLVACAAPEREPQPNQPVGLGVDPESVPALVSREEDPETGRIALRWESGDAVVLERGAGVDAVTVEEKQAANGAKQWDVRWHWGLEEDPERKTNWGELTLQPRTDDETSDNLTISLEPDGTTAPR